MVIQVRLYIKLRPRNTPERRDRYEAWQMDSVTNLPPGKILPVTILPPYIGMFPWHIYLQRFLCFSQTLILNTFEIIWIIYIQDWFSGRGRFNFLNLGQSLLRFVAIKIFSKQIDFQADHVYCPIYMHVWKGLNVQVLVIPSALHVIFNINPSVMPMYKIWNVRSIWICPVSIK